MAFAIIRLAKLTSGAAVANSMSHNHRERIPAYAKSECDDRLFSILKTAETYQQAVQNYHDKLPEKVRKNAVHALEFVVSVPPEWTTENMTERRKNLCEKYLKDAAQFIVRRFGGPENALDGVIHWDEKTPHLHFHMMPLKDGKLNAKAYIGGPEGLRQLQTDFTEAMKKRGWKVERGVSKTLTGRHHNSHKDYHALEQEVEKLRELKEKIVDTADQIRQELAAAWADQLEKARTSRNPESKAYHSAMCDGIAIAQEIVERIAPKKRQGLHV